MKKQLFILSSLIIFNSPLLSMDTFGGQQHLVRRNMVQEKYYDLFLDPWQKLVLSGNNAEAAHLAAQQENEFCKEINESFDKNKAHLYGEYRKSQDRKGLDTQERFSTTFFRLHGKLEDLIEIHESKIKGFMAEFDQRQKMLENLENKEKTTPKQKDVLQQKIDIEYPKIDQKIGKFLLLSDERPFFEKLRSVRDNVHRLTEMMKLDPQKLREIDLNMERDKAWESLNEVSSALDQESPICEENNVQAEKFNQLKYVFDCFYGAPLSFLDDIKTWCTIHPDETLPEFERFQLNSMRNAQEAFRKDTEEKIAMEKKRMEFIKMNPSFFDVPVRSRAHILGIENPDQWSGEACMNLGKGVVVGIVDIFDKGKQNSRILHKATNPDFMGVPYLGYQDVNKDNHGIHVAGIIVSDRIDPIDAPMTLGVAPEAQFDMLPYQALSSRKLHMPVGGAAIEEIDWTVEKMAEAITRLSLTGEVKELDLSLNQIMENPIVQSSAQIMNWSMTTSNLGRWGRAGLHAFEGESQLLVLVKSLQTKLWVIATGNDGIDLSSTSQHRLKRALTHSPVTVNHVLLVTNLMQDGLTIYKESNIPGKDPLVQRRTLSAPGTKILSTLLMRTDESPAFGDMTGTSMAAPHVSGIAAVVLSNHPGLSPQELNQCLLEGATPLVISEEGITSEISGVTADELRLAFENSPYSDSVNAKGYVVNRTDWERGKETYGQGRVNLAGALRYAQYMDMT